MAMHSGGGSSRASNHEFPALKTFEYFYISRFVVDSLPFPYLFPISQSRPIAGETGMHNVHIAV